MGFQALDIKLHGLLHIGQGFLSSRPLRNAPWQCGNLRHEYTVFILLNEYPELKAVHIDVRCNHPLFPKMPFNTAKIAIIRDLCNQYWNSSSPAARSRGESKSAYHHIPARGRSDLPEYHVGISMFTGHMLLILECFEILTVNRRDFECFRLACQFLQIGE